MVTKTIPLHRTKNDLSEAKRGQLVELLNTNLAAGIDLYLSTKHSHWNVKGTSFIALHELFDQVADVVRNSVDDIAERAVQLGGTAFGTIQSVAKQTGMKPYPTTIVDGKEHVEALSSALAAFGAQVRAAIEQADEIGDAGTADLFTAVSREIDKQLWFVEAHAQSK